MAGDIDKPLLDWEANAPRSILFDDIYFSGEGAAETRHVFIDGNDLHKRLASCDRFAIGELGFGSGLNFLSVLELWRSLRRHDGARLDYLAFEKYPLTNEDLARAHSAWPQFADVSRRLIAAAPPPIGGFHRLHFGNGVTLTLVYGDVADTASRINAAIDAWFLDGFAPAKNPDMWSPALFNEVARLSRPDATISTFTVAGAVRRALADAGFAVAKRAGYGRKREMLVGRLIGERPGNPRPPWFANRGLNLLNDGDEIAIVGGGVAGASLACEARRAGLRPVIFDREGLAAGASGNPAGIIMPRLDLGDTAGPRFFANAYAFALRSIDLAEHDSAERFFNRCGVLLKAATQEERERQHRIIARRLLPPAFIEARVEGLFFPQGGVIEPRRYCRALALGAEFERRGVIGIVTSTAGAALTLDGGDQREFKAAIIANAGAAKRFLGARTLPLSPVKGQIDVFPEAETPSCVVACGPYAAPAPGGGMVIGATYEHGAQGEILQNSIAATMENVAAVASAMPALARSLDPAHSRPRAAFRCQTPDRLPVAGPAPDWNEFGADYDDLRLGKMRDYPPGEVMPNLFILSGLGSRGLVTASFAAALMVAEMTGAPVEREIADALHPGRFFIRDLKRASARK